MPPRVERADAGTDAAAHRAAAPRAARDLPSRELPSRDLPQRDSRVARPSLPTRTPALPRPADKELPVTASAAPLDAAHAAAARGDAAAANLGAASGSSAGSGPLTLNVTDFPYAYYIRQIQQKIQERWVGRGIPGQQPAVVFEIRRDGKLNVVAIDRSSGNAYYDQVALRAINDASRFRPFPMTSRNPC